MSATAQPPKIGTTGAQIYENMGSARFAEPDTGYALARFCDALSWLLDPIADVTRAPDGSIRWEVLGSPRRCPADWLPVLAQWAGVRRPDALTEEQLRELIGPTAPGMWRGTRAAMIAAIRHLLPEGTPDRFVYFEERADGDPYKLRVFTFAFIEHDQEAVHQALLAAKPAGLWPFVYEVRVGQTYDMLNRRVESYAEMNERYANYWECLHDEPI